MYGQTEATARMAYLPPALTEAHPAAIGVAIPGGALRLEPGRRATGGRRRARLHRPERDDGLRPRRRRPRARRRAHRAAHRRPGPAERRRPVRGRRPPLPLRQALRPAHRPRPGRDPADPRRPRGRLRGVRRRRPGWSSRSPARPTRLAIDEVAATASAATGLPEHAVAVVPVDGGAAAAQRQGRPGRRRPARGAARGDARASRPTGLADRALRAPSSAGTGVTPTDTFTAARRRLPVVRRALAASRAAARPAARPTGPTARSPTSPASPTGRAPLALGPARHRHRAAGRGDRADRRQPHQPVHAARRRARPARRRRARTSRGSTSPAPTAADRRAQPGPLGRAGSPSPPRSGSPRSA